MTFMETVVNGLATGLGCAVGTWLSQRAIIKHLERLEKKFKEMVK